MLRTYLIALVAGCAGAAGAAGAAGGCAGSGGAVVAAQPPDRTAHELGFHPGENLSYEVKLQGVLVGEAQLAVGEVGKVDGRAAVVVTSRAATAGVASMIKHMVDESTTVIDLETGRPLKVDTLVVAGEQKTTATAKFNGSKADVTYQRSNDKPVSFAIPFRDAILLDLHTVIGRLRGWRATRGVSESVFVIGGRRLWRIDIRYVGDETVDLRLGSRRAAVYEGTTYRARADLGLESTKPARHFRAWMSDDADRVPLKLSANTEFGDIIMELIEYQPP